MLFFLSIVSLIRVAKADSDESIQWELGGNLKSIGSYQKLRSTGLFEDEKLWVWEERLRVIGAATWSNLRFEVHSETSFFLSSPNKSYVPLPSFVPANAWMASWNPVNLDSTKLSQKIDRAYAQYTDENVEVIVGKQVVATGVGRIFNAISQVPRLPFVIVDPEYPFTEDGFTGIWKGPLSLEARFLPKVQGQTKDNFHLRAKSSKHGFDVAFTGGRSDDKSYFGVETAGNIGDSLLRAEVVHYDKNGKDSVQALLGFDTVVSREWSFEVETFYNGFGRQGGEYEISPLVHRSSPYQGLWYFGLHTAYELSQRLKLQFLGISNLLDPSFLGHVWLVQSLSTSIDISLGHFFSMGAWEDSEFGGQLPTVPRGGAMGVPDMTYIQLKLSF